MTYTHFNAKRVFACILFCSWPCFSFSFDACAFVGTMIALNLAIVIQNLPRTQKMFNLLGFTHVFDMGISLFLWYLLWHCLCTPKFYPKYFYPKYSKFFFSVHTRRVEIGHILCRRSWLYIYICVCVIFPARNLHLLRISEPRLITGGYGKTIAAPVSLTNADKGGCSWQPALSGKSSNVTRGGFLAFKPGVMTTRYNPQ